MALAPLSASFQSLPPLPTNQIGRFWCCFPSGWVCVCSRTLWVSPMNSPVRLGVFPAAASTPTGVFNQWFEALFPRAGTLGCEVCHWVLPCWPALPTPLHNLPPRWVCQLRPCLASSAALPISAPPTGLDECVFFISLGWTSIQFDFLSVLVVFCF